MSGSRQHYCVGAAAVLLLVAPTAAQQVGHLDPEASAFGRGSWHTYYDRVVSDVLKDAFAPDVLGSVIIEPSFTAEYAVGISADKDHYSIFTLRPAHHLWAYQLLRDMEDGNDVVLKDGKQERDVDAIGRLHALLPTDWHDVKVARCDAAIDAALGKQIAEAWRLTLLTTHYEPPPPITVDKDGKITSTVTVQLDGTFYHFAAGDMAGQDYNPGNNSVSSQLAGIAFTMDDYCKTRNPDDLKSMSNAADTLVKALREAFADP